MITFEKLKESYEKLRDEYGYAYTGGTHQECGTLDEFYVLVFTYMGFGFKKGFEYAFAVYGYPDGDEVTLIGETREVYTPQILSTIANFVEQIYMTREEDNDVIKQFVKYLNEHKERKG